MNRFEQLIESRQPVLTDGGIETRVMFETGIEMDPEIQVAGMLDDPVGREELKTIYYEYILAARDFGLPVIVGTPTFRASPNFIGRAGRPASDVERLNAEAVKLHDEIRQVSGHRDVFIAGVIGPSGDAYLPGEALSAEAGADYHQPQAEALAIAGADFLFAPTFPSVDEAEGASVAMKETGLPHVISYILGPDGNVLDGTPLAEAIERIDGNPEARPLYHSLSCIHALAAKVAIAKLRVDSETAYHRLAEFKANGSPLRTDRLVQLDHPETDDPKTFAAEMIELFDPDGLRVLGGCCGTGQDHIKALARLLARISLA